METYGRDRMLALVERSPAAAAAHDRQAWVRLFVDGAMITDPVGSRAHVGQAEIERFYDTFIGPRNVVFHPGVDVVGGCAVIRDLDLEIEMSPRVTLRVPVFIRYDLHEIGGDLRIARLAAYWELPEMITQFMRCGLAAVPVGAKLTTALLRNQGVRGTIGFAEGLRRAGPAAKSATSSFLDAVSGGDVSAARRFLNPNASLVVLGGDVVCAEDVMDSLRGVRVRKVLVAGNTVAAALENEQRKGVGLFTFRDGDGPMASVEIVFDA